MRFSRTICFSAAALLTLSCHSPKDGEYHFHILTTSDIHGCYFDSTYVDGSIRPSLLAVSEAVDSLRSQYGEGNVILIDDGDFLQGDNAAFYFNYVDTKAEHVYPRMAKYMGYDAIVAGNHDIEAGHEVYDRINDDLKKAGIPFLGGNIIRNDDGKPYFPYYTTITRQGMKIAILGYDNANIAAWLDEKKWEGMKFESLVPLVQKGVDEVIAKEKPQVVIVAVHSGKGEGDGTVLENQGMDLFNSLKGVQVLICGHDHKPYFKTSRTCAMINSGSRCANLGHVMLDLKLVNRKIAGMDLIAGLIPIKAGEVDMDMKEKFYKDYRKVKDFTLAEVGELKDTLNLNESFTGMSDYLKLIATVCLKSSGAQLTIVAPISKSGRIDAGKVSNNDLFTLYQYENELFVASMTGKEVKDYLEYSYDLWINTVDSPDDHVLNIANEKDERNDVERWEFRNPTFNFDSMAGLYYTVDVTKPFGERVNITSLADGSPFSADGTYSVALTSYRASGGGYLLSGAGMDVNEFAGRVTEKYPEIRTLLGDYLKANGAIGAEDFSDTGLLGHWEFVPEDIVHPKLEEDISLVFGK